MHDYSNRMFLFISWTHRAKRKQYSIFLGNDLSQFPIQIIVQNFINWNNIKVQFDRTKFSFRFLKKKKCQLQCGECREDPRNDFWYFSAIFQVFKILHDNLHRRTSIITDSKSTIGIVEGIESLRSLTISFVEIRWNLSHLRGMKGNKIYMV